MIRTLAFAIGLPSASWTAPAGEAAPESDGRQLA
jgi:hypothetical protein